MRFELRIDPQLESHFTFHIQFPLNFVFDWLMTIVISYGKPCLAQDVSRSHLTFAIKGYLK